MFAYVTFTFVEVAIVDVCIHHGRTTEYIHLKKNLFLLLLIVY